MKKCRRTVCIDPRPPHSSKPSSRTGRHSTPSEEGWAREQPCGWLGDAGHKWAISSPWHIPQRFSSGRRQNGVRLRSHHKFEILPTTTFTDHSLAELTLGNRATALCLDARLVCGTRTTRASLGANFGQFPKGSI
jgi:hypothetical protein